MKLEVCIDSLTSAKNAVQGGATRLEICGPLVAGGTTPSLGLVESVNSYLMTVNRPTTFRIMIRSREGDFDYNEAEKEVMLLDTQIFCAREHLDRCEGFVVGAHTVDGDIDWDFLFGLLCASYIPQHWRHTLHRVVDILSWHIFDCEDTWKRLQDLRIDTILTSGRKPTCLEGVDDLVSIMLKAQPFAISIMPGGGIKDETVLQHLIKHLKGAKVSPDWVHASGSTAKASLLTKNKLFHQWTECDSGKISRLIAVMNSVL